MCVPHSERSHIGPGGLGKGFEPKPEKASEFFCQLARTEKQVELPLGSQPGKFKLWETLQDKMAHVLQQIKGKEEKGLRGRGQVSK